MTTLGECIRSRRKELGLTQEQLEGRSGISQTHISQLENDHTERPTVPTLYALSDALSIPLSQLQRLAGYIIEEVRPDPVTVPVRDWGYVPADHLRRVESEYEGRMFDVPLAHTHGRSADELFVLHARGDCLARRGIVDGAIVVCEKANGRQPHNGQLVAVRVGDERSLKIWHREGKVVRLHDGDGNIVAILTPADDIAVVGFVLTSWIDHTQ